MLQDYTGAVGGSGGMLNPERDRQFMAASFYTTQIANGQLLQDSQVRRSVRKLMMERNISEAQALDELMNTKQGQMQRDVLMGLNASGWIGHTNHLNNARFAMDIFSRGGVTANLFDGGGQLAGVNQSTYGAGSIAAQAATAYLNEVNAYFGDRDQIGNMSRTDFLETSALLNQRGALGLRAEMRQFDLTTDAGVRAAAQAASRSGLYDPDTAARLGSQVSSVADLSRLQQELQGQGDAGSAKFREALQSLGEFRGLSFDQNTIRRATETVKEMGNVMDAMRDLYGELNSTQQMQVVESIAGTRMTSGEQVRYARQVLDEQRGAASAAGMDVRSYMDQSMSFMNRGGVYLRDVHGQRGVVAAGMSDRVNRGLSRMIFDDVTHQVQQIKSSAQGLGMEGVSYDEEDMRKRSLERTKAFMDVHPGMDLAMRLHHNGRFNGSSPEARAAREGFAQMQQLISEHRFDEAEALANDISRPWRGRMTAGRFNDTEGGIRMIENNDYKRSLIRTAQRAYAADRNSNDVYADADIAGNFNQTDYEFIRDVSLGANRGLGASGIANIVSLNEAVNDAPLSLRQGALDRMRAGINDMTGRLGYSEQDAARLNQLLTGSNRENAVAGLATIGRRIAVSSQVVGQAAFDRMSLDDEAYAKFLKASDLGLANAPDLSLKNFVRLFLTGNKQVGDNERTLAMFASLRSDRELDEAGVGFARGVGMDPSDKMDMETYKRLMSIGGGESLHASQGISAEAMLNRINTKDGKALLLSHLRGQGVEGVRGVDGRFFFTNVDQSSMDSIKEQFRNEIVPKSVIGRFLHGSEAYDAASPDDKLRMDREIESFMGGDFFDIADQTTGSFSRVGVRGTGNTMFEGQGHGRRISGGGARLLRMLTSGDVNMRKQALEIMSATDAGLGGFAESYKNLASDITRATTSEGGFAADRILLSDGTRNFAQNKEEAIEILARAADVLEAAQKEKAGTKESSNESATFPNAVIYAKEIIQTD